MSIISRMYGPKEVIIKGDYEFPDPVRVTECILGTSMESTISPHHREGRHQPEITEKKRNVLGLSAHSRILTPILRHESAKSPVRGNGKNVRYRLRRIRSHRNKTVVLIDCRTLSKLLMRCGDNRIAPLLQ